MKLFDKEIFLDEVVLACVFWIVVVFIVWQIPITEGEKIGLVFLLFCLWIFHQFSQFVLVAILGSVLAASNIVLYLDKETTNAAWRKATAYVVAEHNKVGALRTPVTIEEMTPQKLLQLTNPCTVWDWRERGKKCKKE